MPCDKDVMQGVHHANFQLQTLSYQSLSAHTTDLSLQGCNTTFGGRLVFGGNQYSTILAWSLPH